MPPPRLFLMIKPSSYPMQRYLPPVLLVLSLLGAYLATIAPGLTWANGGSDGGDLITAAATGGVPHPTGYPLYLVLARLFQFLPAGSLAFRTNLLSAMAAALAAVFVYRTVTRAQSCLGFQPVWLAGMAAGYAFGLAPLIWSQAVITEVYALQALLVALVLYLYSGQPDIRSLTAKRLDCLRGLVLGLAIANHVTAILLLPAALLVGSFRRSTGARAAHSRLPDLRFHGPALLRQLGCFAIGLCLYLLLPLRAAALPPVNWGNVQSLDRFWWLISGQLYQSFYPGSQAPEIGARVREAAGLLLGQFGLPALFLGLIGLIVFWKTTPLLLLTAWTAAGHLAFAVFYDAPDWQVYLIPALMCFSIWIGLGLAGLAGQLKDPAPLTRIGITLLVIGYLAARALSSHSLVDASQDQRAESFGGEVLARAPRQAILFAEGDPAIFALWYFHFALEERPDLAVVAPDLLHFEWYQETLRATYPSLIVPRPFPWAETIAAANPSRVICYVRYSDHTEMECP